MAPTRVRDCVAEQFFEVVLRQADASRGLNGPRKATFCRSSTARFRSKSHLANGPDGQRSKRRLVVAIDAAKVSVGECGVENQVGRVGVTSYVQAWTNSGKPIDFDCMTLHAFHIGAYERTVDERLNT